MKLFRWMKVRRPNVDTEIVSLMECVEGNRHIFWGILSVSGNGYTPIMFKKDRSGYITIEEVLPLKEAKLALEKNMMDLGIMEDGDTLEDYTE